MPSTKSALIPRWKADISPMARRTCRGESADTVLLTCHCCHPSLCNDNLSGVALATFLVRQLSAAEATALLIPGAVHSRHDRLHHVAGEKRGPGAVNQTRSGAGLRRRCGKLTYKTEPRGKCGDRSRCGERLAYTPAHTTRSWTSRRMDTMSASSIHRDLNCTWAASRALRMEQYPEYHTSADNLELVRPEALGGLV